MEGPYPSPGRGRVHTDGDDPGLAVEPPGSARWSTALAVMEGGALRTRRAVMLAGEVLGDAECSSPEALLHARRCTR